ALGGVRLPHGGCPRGLPPPVRPQAPRGVRGRDLQAADRRDPRALTPQGRRHSEVTQHRRRTDWAGFIRALLEGRYQEAEKLVLVMDQLNTHSPASLYEAFPAEEAKRLADRLEIHHTPKHG